MKKFFLCFILTVLISFYLVPQNGLAGEAVHFSDDEIFDQIQKGAVQYFLREADPQTGLVYDHASNGRRMIESRQASIAATGFGLTAYAVGVQRNLMEYEAAKERTRKTLRFFLERAQQEHGFFYHFLNPKNGQRSGRSELSPIDTSLFLAGALFAAEYYEDATIRDLAQKIYERVDWAWMLHGGNTLAMSWSPEHGFSKRRWNHYDESMIMYLLAIGSPSHPIPADSWKAIERPVGSYRGHRIIISPPLFTHQYSHIWIDFRNQHDGFADYFKNSVEATLANRQFAMDQSARYQTYGPDVWGLTASNGPFGYKAYGAPPGWATHDGTIAPTACISSVVFTPQESIACMRHLFEHYTDSLWGRYGFSDAFNGDKKWFDDNVIGIDQGAMVLMIENYRSELIWKTMKKNAALQSAMKAVGFQPGTQELSWPEPPVYEVPYTSGGMRVDGYMKDWPNIPAIHLDRSHRESGEIENDQDLSADVRFAWNEDMLFFIAKINDQSLVLKRAGKNIWQDDLLELFVNPREDGLKWGRDQDYQIGFRAHSEDSEVSVWSWFQDEDPSRSDAILARGAAYDGGYVIEGAIRWKYLRVRPVPGGVLRVSPAVHDADRDRSESKANWFFRNEEEEKNFVLGQLILQPPAPAQTRKEPA